MTRKADGIRRRWCKPSRPAGAGAHGSIPIKQKELISCKTKTAGPFTPAGWATKRCIPAPPPKVFITVLWPILTGTQPARRPIPSVPFSPMKIPIFIFLFDFYVFLMIPHLIVQNL